MELTLRREFSYYMLTIYVPTCMLVIVSWYAVILLTYHLDNDIIYFPGFHSGSTQKRCRPAWRWA